MKNVRNTKAIGITAVLLLTGGAVVACNDDADEQANQVVEGSADDAKEKNRSREVDERFGEAPKVIADADNSGVETSEFFYDNSQGVIVSASDDADILRAASVGVLAHAPVLRFTPESDNASAINEEISRLGADTVLTIGDIDDLDFDDELTVIADPGTDEGLGKLLDEEVTTESVSASEANERLAALGADDATVLELGAKNSAGAEGTEGAENSESTTSESEDASETSETSESSSATSTTSNQSDSDSDQTFPVADEAPGSKGAPIVAATARSSAGDVATAKGYGSDVRVMDYADPRINDAAGKMVAGLSDMPVVALGGGFGSDESFAKKIALSEKDTAELPGGGNLVFPGRRMIAYYGFPQGPELGIMGEDSPEGSVAHLEELVEQYQALDEGEPVIPAFEIIASVASSEPGPDGSYSSKIDASEIQPYIDAVVDAGGYAIIDLQTGREDFLSQAKHYEELLKQPNVGLALDPEWRIGDNELPLSRVGSVEAAEVNEVSEWLAQLVDDNDLPQKIFMLHQFQHQMLRDRDQIRTDRPELTYVLHADGHGTPDLKFGTWNELRQNLSPDYFMAWKNFFDEDNPTFTPEQTFDVDPTPWLISYQ